MRVRLVKSILPPDLVAEREGMIVGVDLHRNELPLVDTEGIPRASITTDGCALLRYTPLAIHVRIDNCLLELLPPRPCEEHIIAGPNRECKACEFFVGIVPIEPSSATWQFKPPHQQHKSGIPACAIPVRRTQIALAPAQCKTLHGLQGFTAKPGLLAHFALPPLSASSKWLAFHLVQS